MKKSKSLLKIIAVSLIFIFLLTGCADKINYLFGIRNTINFDEMPYSFEENEAEDILEKLDEYVSQAKDAKSYTEIQNIEYNINELLGDFLTKYSVLNIYTYLDKDNENYRDTQKEISEKKVEIFNKVNNFYKIIVNVEFNDKFKEDVGEYQYECVLNSILLDDESVMQEKKEIEQISIEYNEKLTKLSAEYDGNTYLLDELDTYSDLTSEEIQGLTDLCYYQNAEKFSKMYIDTINLNNQRAKKLGFENVADMYYKSHNRDYTPKDAENLIQNYKKTLGEDLLKYLIFTGLDTTVHQPYERTMRNFENVLPQISQEMEDCFSYMQEFNLYSIEADKTKNKNVAFTQDLTIYDAFYMYMYWDETFTSTNTLFHEFGHCFESYKLYKENNYTLKLDIAEIFSVSLELLMHKYYNEFLDFDEEQLDMLKMSSISGTIVNTIGYQLLLEEFQLKAYQMQAPTAQKLAQLYGDLSYEYGFSFEPTPDYTWYRVTHLFDAPFYTISYATSALVALQLWAISQDDWDLALEKYMQFIETDHDQQITQMIEQNELTSPMEYELFETVDKAIDKVYGEKFDSYLDDYLNAA